MPTDTINVTPITRADITGDSAWWCLGCGDFGVNSAVQQVIMSLVNEGGVPLENMFALSGIGCSSKEPDMLRVNAYQGQHGRSLPVAIGVAIANPGLKVLDFGGDGDTYAIGMEHFMHADHPQRQRYADYHEQPGLRPHEGSGCADGAPGTSHRFHARR